MVIVKDVYGTGRADELFEVKCRANEVGFRLIDEAFDCCPTVSTIEILDERLPPEQRTILALTEEIPEP